MAVQISKGDFDEDSFCSLVETNPSSEKDKVTTLCKRCRRSNSMWAEPPSLLYTVYGLQVCKRWTPPVGGVCLRQHFLKFPSLRHSWKYFWVWRPQCSATNSAKRLRAGRWAFQALKNSVQELSFLPLFIVSCRGLAVGWRHATSPCVHNAGPGSHS